MTTPTNQDWDALTAACRAVEALSPMAADTDDLEERRAAAKTTARSIRELANEVKSPAVAEPTLLALRDAYAKARVLSDRLITIRPLVPELADVVSRLTAQIEAYPPVSRSSSFRSFAAELPNLPEPQWTTIRTLAGRTEAIARTLETAES